MGISDKQKVQLVNYKVLQKMNLELTLSNFILGFQDLKSTIQYNLTLN